MDYKISNQKTLFFHHSEATSGENKEEKAWREQALREDEGYKF